MRLFIAIELDDAARRNLAAVQSRLAAFDPRRDVRWAAQHQLHLTLRFMGEVADENVTRLSRAMDEAAAAAAPFAMRGGVAGCFPAGGPVRIVWAGIDEPTGALAALAAAVERKAVELGWPPDTRPFHAHVTLGRVNFDRSRGDLRRGLVSPAAAEWTQSVGRLVVMASRLQRGGSQYSVVSTHDFGGK